MIRLVDVGGLSNRIGGFESRMGYCFIKGGLLCSINVQRAVLSLACYSGESSGLLNRTCRVRFPGGGLYCLVVQW